MSANNKKTQKHGKKQTNGRMEMEMEMWQTNYFMSMQSLLIVDRTTI